MVSCITTPGDGMLSVGQNILLYSMFRVNMPAGDTRRDMLFYGIEISGSIFAGGFTSAAIAQAYLMKGLRLHIAKPMRYLSMFIIVMNILLVLPCRMAPVNKIMSGSGEQIRSSHRLHGLAKELFDLCSNAEDDDDGSADDDAGAGAFYYPAGTFMLAPCANTVLVPGAFDARPLFHSNHFQDISSPPPECLS